MQGNREMASILSILCFCKFSKYRKKYFTPSSLSSSFHACEIEPLISDVIEETNYTDLISPRPEFSGMTTNLSMNHKEWDVDQRSFHSMQNLVDTLIDIIKKMNILSGAEKVVAREINSWLHEHNIDPELVFEFVGTQKETRYIALLGFFYFYGIGTEVNLKNSVKFYEIAAEMGDSEVQCQIGCLYYYGIELPLDYNKAFYWFEKSAKAGVAAAQAWIGGCYECGHGTKKDDLKAFNWYKLSAEGNDSSGFLRLGICYEEGIGTERNETLAAEYYRRSAERGHRSGQHQYALFLCKGIGIEKNTKEAIYWLQKAISQGNIPSENQLAYLYMNEAQPRNPRLAFYWYQHAALQGDSMAQLNTAVCRQIGGWLGTSQDIHQALIWYRRAISNGNSIAISNLREFYLGM
ncbi:hypothetical protein G9A89_021764 [Geosiphon pyriformis]|nr:hypothetical protein G9A89_021764 [Geosiphon pyriformis]